MKIIINIILFLTFNFSLNGQGRKVDGSLKILSPKPNDTIESRKNGIYQSRFIIKNNGPDTIKPWDYYEIKVTFSNVIYNPYSGRFNKTVLPNSQDTINVPLKMSWGATAFGANFCAILVLTGINEDSIRQESNLLNNKECLKVDHLSKLGLNVISEEKIMIYPNPTKGILYFKGINEIDSQTEINIYSAMGALVSTSKLKIFDNLYSSDISHLKKGLYLIQFKLGEKSYTTKILLTN